MRRDPRLWSLVLSACLFAGAGFGFAACGSSSPGGAGFSPDDAATAQDGAPIDAGLFANLDTLTVSPPTADIVAGDAPTTATFTVQAKFKDGTTRDVTSLVTWQTTPQSMLVMQGATVSGTGASAGDGQVLAYIESVSGAAQVHVKLVENVLLNGAPPTAPQQLAGGTDDPTLAPKVVYPLDGALFPPNIGAPDVQFTPAAGTTIFDVAFSSPSLDVHLYTPCKAIGATAGCSLVPDAKTWGAIATTLRGADPATVTVRAAGATAGKVGTTKLALQLAGTDVAGGLYYFNTKPQPLADGGAAPPGIYRYDFDNARHEPFFTRDNCAGCHALSKDGTKVLAPICTNARGCGRPLQLAVVDVATGHVDTPPFPVGDTDTLAWTPDNKYYVTTPSCVSVDPNPPNACVGGYSGGVLTLVDAATNAAVGNVPAGAGAMYPSFSNDGKRLVYARAGKYDGPLSIEASSLFAIDFTAPAWGAEKSLLASGGENNYHPSFSPDDAWVIFARSTCDAGAPVADCDSYDDPAARVTVLPAAGGAAIDLANANGQGKLTNSWPKWSPFKGKYKAGDILWLTFSSARDYGYRTYDTNGQPTHFRQLWVVAFDPARAAAGKDPSFAPVWLPFQDAATSNHIGQWTEKVVPGPK
jgi:WD40-like Beta Propeller Repeat